MQIPFLKNFGLFCALEECPSGSFLYKTGDEWCLGLKIYKEQDKDKTETFDSCGDWLGLPDDTIVQPVILDFTEED